MTLSEEASSKSRWRPMQRSTVQHQVKSGQSCGRIRERNQQVEGSRISQEDLQSHLIFDHVWLTEPGLPTREHAGAGTKFPTHL